MKRAPRRLSCRVRNVARNCSQSTLGFAGNGSQQPLRIRMERLIEYLIDARIFYDFSGIHHRNPVSYFGNYTQVVSD